MDVQRKHAYRWLLYRALLDIRPLRWASTRWRERLNPSRWSDFLRRARCGGAVADWLHNLAMFSALEFEQFDEGRFWQDHEWFVKNYPWAGLNLYRDQFEQHVTPR